MSQAERPEATGIDQLFAEDLRAAVTQHETSYRQAFGRHSWNTLDLVEARRLPELGIKVKLPKSALKRQTAREKAQVVYHHPFTLPVEPTWVRINDSQWVDRFVEDVDSVAPNGVIRMFIGEADPNLYNHPLVVEAMVRAKKPAEAFLAQSKRGASMVDQRRSLDAVYDFQYAEFLANRLGLSVYAVRRKTPDDRRVLQLPLGDMFGRFGFSLMVLGQPDQARPRLERALGHNPRQEYVNHNLGQCLRVLGEPTDLVAKYYRRELKVNPTHPSAAQDLAGIRS